MVFVLDSHKKPLMPCSEKRARQLLERGRAVVHRQFPFTLRLKDRTVAHAEFQPLRLKLDPGSQTTGWALILDGAHGSHAIGLGEIVHRRAITLRLTQRAALRRGRRFRHTRYRPARFANRHRRQGWLPPSLEARVDQTLHAVQQLRRALPITALSVEHVRFDTQKLQDPEITGVAYQQGTLLGYEIREYLLDKWDRQCAYCDARNVSFQIDHIHAKDRGGSDRVCNLALACPTCNAAKGTQSLQDFLADDRGRHQRATHHAQQRAGHDPQAQSHGAQWEAERLARIQRQRKAPLKDAAAMNATRWRLYYQLQATGLPLEGGSGGRTKKQRIEHQLPKEHYYDALCVGASTPEHFQTMTAYVQVWIARGRGNRQRCRTDAYGFPIAHRARTRQHFGFQTGDLVRAVIPRGKYCGTWTGRATVKASGQILVTTDQDIHPTTSYRHCRILQRGNGWQTTQKSANPERSVAAFSPA